MFKAFKFYKKGVKLASLSKKLALSVAAAQELDKLEKKKKKLEKKIKKIKGAK